MFGTLSLGDVRALLHLLGELREMGDDPHAWRAHLASALEPLCDCRAVLLAELAPRSPRPEGRRYIDLIELVDVEVRGVANDQRERFLHEIFWFDHAGDTALARLARLYSTNFTRSRAEVISDEEWYRSPAANDRFAPNDCDDFIVSFAHAPGGAMAAMALYRPWRGQRFGERERGLVELLHGEILRDIGVDERPRLPPRAREVLGALETGRSEKEIAALLDLSPHTTHDYVKTIYRAFGVRTRPELMVKLHDRRRRLKLRSA
jgi:DNA-binding CsgD family transcriptional regulator